MRDLAEGDIEVKESAGKISGDRASRIAVARDRAPGDTEPVTRGERAACRHVRRGACRCTSSISRRRRRRLPFHAGQRPYQPILFQFSHHVVTQDGRVRHATECLIVDGEDVAEH